MRGAEAPGRAPGREPPAPPAKGKRTGPRVTLDRVFRVALVLIPFGVLGNLALSWATTDRSVLAHVPDLPRGYLLLAVALGLAPWFTNALRLWVWTRFLSIPIRYREAFRITLGAELGSSVLPTSSGGELFRWGMMVQRGVTPGAAASIITLGHAEDSLFFLLALPTAAVLSSAWNLPVLHGVAARIRVDSLDFVLVAAAALLVLGVLWRAVLRGRVGARARRRGLHLTAGIRRRLRKAWREMREVWRLVAARGKLRFALTMAITAVQWSCRYSVVSALAAFLGAPVNPVLFFLLQWVVFTVMLFIPTPGASGGAEAAFYLVYSALLPGRVIGLMTAGWRFLTFYLQLTLGALLFTLLGALESRALRPGGPAEPARARGRRSEKRRSL